MALDITVFNKLFVLASGVTSELLFDGATANTRGIDVSGLAALSLSLTNGADGADNDLTLLELMWTDDVRGVNWASAVPVTLPSAGLLLKGETVNVTAPVAGMRRLRIRAASSLGATRLRLDLFVSHGDVEGLAVNNVPVLTPVVFAGTVPTSSAAGSQEDGHSDTLGSTGDAESAVGVGSVVALLKRARTLLGGLALETTLGAVGALVTLTNSALAAISAQLPGTLGTQAAANSIAVTLASDQPPIDVSIPGAVTIAQPVAITSGTLATEATLATRASEAALTSLSALVSALSAKLPATLGTKPAATSLAVTLASDQPPVVVSVPGAVTIGQPVAATNSVGSQVDGHSATLGATGDVESAAGAGSVIALLKRARTLLGGLALEATLAAISSKLPGTLGTKPAATSFAVTLASDQPAIATSITGAVTIAQPVAVTALQLPVVLGTQVAATSLSVTLASDQPLVPVSGTVDQGAPNTTPNAWPVKELFPTGQYLPDQTGPAGGAVLTFAFASPVDFVEVVGIGGAPAARCDPFGGTPTAALGVPLLDGVSQAFLITTSVVRVFAPVNRVITVWGSRH